MLGIKTRIKRLWRDYAWRYLGINIGTTHFDRFLPPRRKLKSMTIADVGCGLATASRRLPCKKLLAVDIYEPYLEIINKRKDKHVETICLNIREFPDYIRKYNLKIDIALLGDVIEHLEKEDALKLIKGLKETINKRIIIFVPVGICPQDEDPWGFNNPYHKHLSQWRPADLEQLGFKVEVWEKYHSKKTNKLLGNLVVDAMMAVIDLDN